MAKKSPSERLSAEEIAEVQNQAIVWFLRELAGAGHESYLKSYLWAHLRELTNEHGIGWETLIDAIRADLTRLADAREQLDAANKERTRRLPLQLGGRIRTQQRIQKTNALISEVARALVASDGSQADGEIINRVIDAFLGQSDPAWEQRQDRSQRIESVRRTVRNHLPRDWRERLEQRRTRTDAKPPASECGHCHGDSKVIDTNDAPGSIRRRRQCLECGRRWTTRELASGI